MFFRNVGAIGIENECWVPRFYGKAMTESKRQAHRKVVEMVLKSRKTEESAGHKQPVAVIGS